MEKKGFYSRFLNMVKEEWEKLKDRKFMSANKSKLQTAYRNADLKIMDLQRDADKIREDIRNYSFDKVGPLIEQIKILKSQQEDIKEEFMYLYGKPMKVETDDEEIE